MSVFQVPILIIGGISIGVIKTKLLASKRQYIYMGLLVALAIITPTTDIFSLGIIFAPCLVIFEISLVGGRIIEGLIRRKDAIKKQV